MQSLVFQQRALCTTKAGRRVPIRKSASCVVAATTGEQQGMVAQNEDIFRALPLYIGAGGFIGALINRIASGAAPVLDAGSSQSRADLAIIVISAVLVLTGLSWISLKPKIAQDVQLLGTPVDYVQPDMPAPLTKELLWAWEGAQQASGATSMVVWLQDRCVLHQGLGAEGIISPEKNPTLYTVGEIVSKVQRGGKANYLGKP